MEVEAALQQASAELAVGELLQADDFSLFATMSAVEVGDAKLDAGMGASSGRSVPMEETAPLVLSPAAQLAVADRLLALEATWHGGHTLAQTVFTCLYLLNPDRCTTLDYWHYWSSFAETEVIITMYGRILSTFTLF